MIWYATGSMKPIAISWHYQILPLYHTKPFSRRDMIFNGTHLGSKEQALDKRTINGISMRLAIKFIALSIQGCRTLHYHPHFCGSPSPVYSLVFQLVYIGNRKSLPLIIFAIACIILMTMTMQPNTMQA